MTIKILVVDEEGLTTAVFGVFDENEIKQIVDFSKKNQLTCLSFIDIIGDTYFNQKQQLKIREELKKLKRDPTINPLLISSIEKSLEIALQDDFSQLKFEGQ